LRTCREVKELFKDILTEEERRSGCCLQRQADTSPLKGVLKGCEAAVTIAQSTLEIKDKDVLLLVDSLTKILQWHNANRAAIGEPPATKGYRLQFCKNYRR